MKTVFAVLLLLCLPFAMAERFGLEADVSTDTTVKETRLQGELKTESNSENRGKRAEQREFRQELREELQEDRSGRIKSRLPELRKEFRSCKEKESDSCIDLRVKVLAEAKAHLATAAQRMLDALNTARIRISSAELDADTKARLLADLDLRITAITEIQTKIAALPDNPSKEEVQELNQELRRAWKEGRHSLRSGTGRMMNSRMAGIVVKSEHLTAKLEKTLEKLKARGVDISGIEADVDAYAAVIAEAKAAQVASLALYASGDVDAAKAQMDIARQKLKDAHGQLKAIVAKIKAANEGNLGADIEPKG
ncbi:MAG TPA: hypothetical protein VJK52_00100 [Candidatus Nanoarchaeia archaeon]|nr:hypothetical protein [Candidatus Nanoarchaeia archaeon]